MTIKNEDYSVYCNYPAEQIPRERLSDFVLEFLTIALFQMNSSLEERLIRQNVESIVDMLKDKFANFQLHMIATAFDQGSLGALGGTAAYKIRNVFIWLSSLKEKQDKINFDEWSRKEHSRKLQEEKEWKENHKGAAIYGTALSIKLSWVYQLRIKPANWDSYTLDSIVSLLRRGETVQTIKPDMIR